MKPKIEVRKIRNNKWELRITSPKEFGSQVNYLELTESQIARFFNWGDKRWNNSNESIHAALPDLTEGERQLILNGDSGWTTGL